MMLEPTQPLSVLRVVQPGGRASATIPFDQPGQLHRIADEDVGDTLLVVTALGPARGFLKPQEFVEFGTLVSTHGVVLQPRADDVTAEVSNDKIVVTRPGGLVLSRGRGSIAEPVRAANDSRPPVRIRLRSIRRNGGSTARGISAPGRHSSSQKRPRPMACGAHRRSSILPVSIWRAT